MTLRDFKIILFLAGVTYVTPANSQNRQDYKWITGSSIGVVKHFEFDFSHDTTQLNLVEIPFAFSEMNSCISDENGNLLLYFNGCDIANGNHELLENGSGFNEGITGNWECPKNYGYPGPYQSALILPKPGNPHFHYVFYTRYDNLPQKIESSLLYAETDLTSGRGKVLYKDKHALTDSVVTLAGITAVKHTNNNDWWLIIGRRYTNRNARLLITANGLVEYPDISIGEDNIKSGGQASFSPDGTKFMRYTPKGLMVMDFDREEGQLSNVRFLPFIPGGVFFGGTFSPNSRFIYLSDRDKIYQVDTWDVELSLDTVEVWDGVKYNGWTVSFGMMQTGPDCRIYISSVSCLPFVHIIMNPDEKGESCNVVQRALELKSSNCGFPHFPNFRLGTSEPYCDPDKVVVTSTINPVDEIPTEPEIFPNPAMKDFNIRSSAIIEEIDIFNIHGQPFYQQLSFTNQVIVSVFDWTCGVYFVQVKVKGSNAPFVRKIVVLP